jgi:alpha-L-fucosidase
MKRALFLILIFQICLASVFSQASRSPYVQESAADHDKRMAWWREARLGLFIHWGLYAIPAGAWEGKYDYGEWIRNSARIPLQRYDQFVSQFNPVRFDAEEWVKTAKAAGMKYIVITSKHHDGFCLFNSSQTDFDVMSTPFRRDILQELAAACRKWDIKLCFYHSIMDWRHPDYLPRRDWEMDRSAEGANFDRYVAYMKAQLRELLTLYGDIGVLWFDGEWESTWNSRYGDDIYGYVRSLQPNIIVNNRVGTQRRQVGDHLATLVTGDFGTPEQKIPDTGLAGLDWETCMTMNDHWGYNSHDSNWKSAQTLIQMLADIASKGGNYLLNVGPTAEGVFPPESVERLRAIGQWIASNGESIYGTQASPFSSPAWGRCTRKQTAEGERLYLHVFQWPKDGKLVLSGIYSKPIRAFLLSDPARHMLATKQMQDELVLSLPEAPPNTINSVVVLDVKGKLDISTPPVIKAEQDLFITSMPVTLSSERNRIEIRYTIDGSAPSLKSPVYRQPLLIKTTSTIKAQSFRDNRPVSGIAERTFTKVTPRSGEKISTLLPGLRFEYYEGDWDSLPDFSRLQCLKKGAVATFDFSPRLNQEHFAFVYTGYVHIVLDGVYTFYTDSDDGSRLYIGENLLVDNDGLHGRQEKQGSIALSSGYHSLRVLFFDKTGGDELHVSIKGPGLNKQEIPVSMLAHRQ